MKRMLGLLMAGSLLLGPAAPAYAGRGGGNGSGDNECGRNGGCNNERDENYSGAGCKYVCPSFDKSPVQDAFNLNVCMPGATCYYGDPKKKDPNQGDGQGQKPQ